MTWRPYLPEPRPASKWEPADAEPVPLEVLRVARELCGGFRTPPRQFRRRVAKRINGTYYPASDIVAVDPTEQPLTDSAVRTVLRDPHPRTPSRNRPFGSPRSCDDRRLLGPWVRRGGRHRPLRADHRASRDRFQRGSSRLAHVRSGSSSCGSASGTRGGKVDAEVDGSRQVDPPESAGSDNHLTRHSAGLSISDPTRPDLQGRCTRPTSTPSLT